MTRTALFLLLFLQAPLIFLQAQTPSIEWQKSFGGANGEYAFSIEQTSDGGYIVAGYTEGPDNGDVLGYHGNPLVQDLWLVKLDDTGNLQWQKCFGGTSFETGAYVHQLPGGGYILAGSAASHDCNMVGNHGGLDYWVIKLTEKGDIIWQKLFGGSQNEYCYSISLTSDGGYVLAGLTESSDKDVTVNHGIRDYWVIKINTDGGLVWQKSLGGTGDDEAFSVQVTNDGGIIVAGSSESNDGDVSGNHGKRDYWIVKLNNTGSIQWQKSLGGSVFDAAWCIQPTADGGYIVAGYSGSNDGDVSGNHHSLGPFLDYWIVKLNNTGSIQWQKCYGGRFNETAYFIEPSPGGGYIVAGSAESDDGDLTCNGSITDVWVLKIDNSGNLEWQKNMGGNMYDEGYCVRPTADGGYIVCGITCSSNVSGHHQSMGGNGTCGDFWIVKLSPASIVQKPIVKIDPLSVIICPGSTATITAVTQFAGTNPSYYWTRNGTIVTNNSPSYTASDFADNEVIVCSVLSGGSCVPNSVFTSDTAIVKLKANTIYPSISITANSTVLCPCTDIEFKATVINGGASPVYQWKINGAKTGNNTSVFISNMLNDGDVITCTYSDNTDCVPSGSIVSNSIQVKRGTNVTPTVTIASSSNNICAGTLVTFTATAVNAGTNPFYQWKVNGNNTGTNSNTFISSSLNNADIVTCTINTDPLFACAIINTASSNTIVINISAPSNPSATITTLSNNVCTGSLVTFTATAVNAGANPSFEWNINGNPVGANNDTFSTSSLLNGDVVNCIVTKDPQFTCAASSTGVSNEIVMVVTTQLASSVSISASDNDVCAGTLVTFSAVGNNAGNSPSYQWLLNNVNVGSNSPFYTNRNLSNGDQLYCLLTPNSGCSNSPVKSNTIAMSINGLPIIAIVPSDTIIIAGSQLQLNGIITGAISSFHWDPPDRLENALTLTPMSTHLSENTTYTLSVISNKGCSASKTATVRIFTALYMPNAFTPNSDGLNDIFRIPPNVSLTLDEFSIYNRWGNKIFSTGNMAKGWDGNIGGKQAGTGVYVYIIKGSNEKGKVFLKGSFVLIR